jgi:hypothetical protein
MFIKSTIRKRLRPSKNALRFYAHEQAVRTPITLTVIRTVRHVLHVFKIDTSVLTLLISAETAPNFFFRVPYGQRRLLVSNVAKDVNA